MKNITKLLIAVGTLLTIAFILLSSGQTAQAPTNLKNNGDQLLEQTVETISTVSQAKKVEGGTFAQLSFHTVNGTEYAFLASSELDDYFNAWQAREADKFYKDGDFVLVTFYGDGTTSYDKCLDQAQASRYIDWSAQETKELLTHTLNYQGWEILGSEEI